MNSSQTELSYIAETNWGVTPTSPAPVFQAIRMTGESLKILNESVESDEIRPDRNVADDVDVGGGASGGIDGELSYGTFDDFLESVLFGTWSTSPANILINGTTQKSFTLQKKQEGNGLAAVYELYNGMVVDTMTINVACKAKNNRRIYFCRQGRLDWDKRYGNRYCRWRRCHSRCVERIHAHRRVDFAYSKSFEYDYQHKQRIGGTTRSWHKRA